MKKKTYWERAKQWAERQYPEASYDMKLTLASAYYCGAMNARQEAARLAARRRKR